MAIGWYSFPAIGIGLGGFGAGVLPPTFALAPSTGLNNASTNTTATGSNTAWTSGTIFSISGVSDASILTNSINTVAQTASLTVITGAGIGTATVSDSTDSATAGFTITLTPPPPIPGGRQFVSPGRASSSFLSTGRPSASYTSQGRPAADFPSPGDSGKGEPYGEK
jgi:hypothetical protein